MVKVEFLGPINKESIEVDIKDLNDLSRLLKGDKELSKWLENCAVAINDTMISSKDIILQDGDRVSLLPPVCGG